MLPLQLQQSIEDHNRQAQPGQDIVFSVGAVACDSNALCSETDD